MAYAGIGSRKTPEDILLVMEFVASELSSEGWTLRSGHAPGADQAFERGAEFGAEIFIPWDGFEKEVPFGENHVVYIEPNHPRDRTNADHEAYSIAKEFHPNWFALKQGGQKMMARNVKQVLGRNLDQPADLVICWTPFGSGQGGTGQAIRVATAHDIPVYDLANPEHFRLFEEDFNAR